MQVETPLLVDTGAALTVLSHRAARTLDLELAYPLRRTSFVFAEGGTQAPVKCDSLASNLGRSS